MDIYGIIVVANTLINPSVDPGQPLMTVINESTPNIIQIGSDAIFDKDNWWHDKQAHNEVPRSVDGWNKSVETSSVYSYSP